jgi:hypothetical protein
MLDLDERECTERALPVQDGESVDRMTVDVVHEIHPRVEAAVA